MRQAQQAFLDEQRGKDINEQEDATDFLVYPCSLPYYSSLLF